MYSIIELERYIERYLEEKYKNSVHALAARIILIGFIKWLKTQEGRQN